MTLEVGTRVVIPLMSMAGEVVGYDGGQYRVHREDGQTVSYPEPYVCRADVFHNIAAEARKPYADVLKTVQALAEGWQARAAKMTAEGLLSDDQCRFEIGALEDCAEEILRAIGVRS